MAERSWFFNSAPGDPRVYQASDFARYFGKVLSTGLLHEDNVPGLTVKTSGMDLRTYVEPGSAIMEGYAYENSGNEYLAHGLPEIDMNRIDRIVLRLDKRNNSRYIRLFVKDGTPAIDPEPPALTRDGSIWELSLAQVLVRANTSSINPADILDERLDRQVAGLVYSLISKPQMADIGTGNYSVRATVAGQTDFVIPNDTFDKDGDGLTVYVDGKKVAEDAYTIVVPRTVRFKTGLPIGSLVDFTVIRGVVKLPTDHPADASDIGIIDAGGYYEDTNVEGALRKIGATLFKPRAKIYGIEIDESNINPETAVSYIEDAVDLGITNPSDWDNYFPFNMFKPCVIRTLENRFETYLNKDNYNLREDGSPIDVSSLVGGDVFIEIPQIWWNISKVGYTVRVRISSEKIDEDWVALAHQKGDLLLPKIYIGAYRSHRDAYNRLRSISNKRIDNSSNTNSEDANAFARNNNCDLTNYYERYILPNILYLIRYKTRNQNRLGGGATMSETASNTGATNTLGMYTDVRPNSINRAKFMGLEDVGGLGVDQDTLKGPVPEFLNGLSFNANIIKIATNNYSSAASYREFNAGDIVSPTYAVYPSTVKGDNNLFLFPTTGQGSSTTHYPFRFERVALTGREGISSVYRGGSLSSHYRITYRPEVPLN